MFVLFHISNSKLYQLWLGGYIDISRFEFYLIFILLPIIRHYFKKYVFYTTYILKTTMVLQHLKMLNKIYLQKIAMLL